jgi:hypothetical protein
VSEDEQNKRLRDDEGSDDFEAHSGGTEQVSSEPENDDSDDSDADFELHGSWGGIG